MQQNSLKQLASDRSLWRSTCHRGAETLKTSLNQKRATKRAQRHQRAQGIIPLNEQHRCHLCNKVCASRIGLHSHLLWHQRNNTELINHLIWSNVFIDFDGLL
ncbi:hypothetical protein Hamer_G000589 [Homarus americanus]|uniref:C2H2-type domain-containing protein n=1 Tax=Homarus americanus TaxID=6706 RepID=A0A8J5NC61_HOMAM|nr:hypothetical protein Hamer_G000589 [Homarus americanus]